MPLPSVSMAALRSRDAAALEALRASLSSVGFLHLSDHGIASEVLGALSVARAFFESDEDTKSKVAHPRKGFIPVDGCVNAVRPPHLHEKFSCGRLADSLVAGDPYYSGPSDEAALYFGDANQWPDEADAPGFRAAYEAAYRAFEGLCLDLHAAVAAALRLPPDFFDAALRRHVLYHEGGDASGLQKNRCYPRAGWRSRLSLVYFCMPGYDTRIEAPAARYPTFLCGQRSHFAQGLRDRCGLPDRQLLAAQAGAAEGGAGRARGSPLPRGEAEEAAEPAKRRRALPLCRLAPELLRQWRARGFAVVRSALAPAEVAALRRESDALQAALEGAGGDLLEEQCVLEVPASGPPPEGHPARVDPAAYFAHRGAAAADAAPLRHIALEALPALAAEALRPAPCAAAADDAATAEADATAAATETAAVSATAAAAADDTAAELAVCLFNEHYVVKPAGRGGGFAWHTDG
ncbi:hypothetical protein EMIHUDRAFT_449671, partial [Emiliania huxleyi CCMP1516]|uniref:Non-haem dioxygenase N-terminal domain-containing protein n=2 Tax=Emiliania huxleyi TaxID=2903 RepID=A0A0D3K5S9_EMIH1